MERHGSRLSLESTEPIRQLDCFSGRLAVECNGGGLLVRMEMRTALFTPFASSTWYQDLFKY